MNIQIDDKIFYFSQEIPEEIFDLINREMVNTKEFLEDPDNVIFIVQDNIIGMSKYFYPFKDDMIIYDCKERGFSYIRPIYQNEQQYINMERIGIILEQPDKNIGVIIKKELLHDQLNKTQIIKLIPKLPHNEIYNATTLSFLKNSFIHGAVSALHCQDGYHGREYLPIDCIEEIANIDDFLVIKSDNYTLSIPPFFKFENLKDNINDNTIKLLDYVINNKDDFLNLSKEQRKYLDKLGYKNPLRYPKQYFNICEEEKTYRNLKGFDKLINLSNYNNDIKNFNLFDLSNVIYTKNTDSKIIGKKDLSIIKDLILNLYPNNLILAGGFALACYKHTEEYNDIDIFIHSCNEIEAKNIIRNVYGNILSSKIVNTFTDSENAFTIYIEYDDNILKIQFIKRIYNSPSEIIHGFDIDSCCILYDNNSDNFYCTKRGLYSLINNTNIVNFDKLSPSYEYRLLKYYKRGFNIYIPQYKYYKDNFIFDINQLTKTNGNIINIYFLNGECYNISDYDNNPSDIDNIEETINNLKFKIINPSEQISNTINSIVLEDILNWYPNSTKEIYNYTPLSSNIIEIDNIIQKNNIGKNLISLKENNSVELKNKSIIIDFLKIFEGKIIAGGNYVLGHLTNKNFYSGIDLYIFKSDPILINTYITMISKGFKTYYLSKFIDINFIDYYGYSEKIYGDYIEIMYEFQYEHMDLVDSIETIPGIRIYTKNIESYNDIFNLYKFDIQKIILTNENRIFLPENSKYCIEEQIIPTKKYINVPTIFYKNGYKQLPSKNNFYDKILE